ncbi:MAG: DUF192 domain-containing protein [Patescibacteria group bacterium]
MNFLKLFLLTALLFSALFLFLFFFWLKDGNISPKYAFVCFNNNICVKSEIAETAMDQARGLMFRKELKENYGMLFTFDKEDYYPFWMKNTFLPLDIIWINNNFKIVDIQKALPCKEQSCATYHPVGPARYVLETNSGFAQKNNIKIEDIVIIYAN